MSAARLLLACALLLVACGEAPTLDDVLDKTAAAVDKLDALVQDAADSDAWEQGKEGLVAAGEEIKRLGAELLSMAKEVADDPRLAEANRVAREQLAAAAERLRALLQKVEQHPGLQAELTELRETLSNLGDGGEPGQDEPR